jgi:hypothetical protein
MAIALPSALPSYPLTLLPSLHSLESRYAHDQFALRGQRVNQKRTQPEGEYVLYWMQSTHRFEENWALRFAVLELGFFEFVHNVRKRGKALLGALIELLVQKDPGIQ